MQNQFLQTTLSQIQHPSGYGYNLTLLNYILAYKLILVILPLRP